MKILWIAVLIAVAAVVIYFTKKLDNDGNKSEDINKEDDK